MHTNRLSRSLIILTLLLVTLISALPAQAGGNVSPQQMLTEYFNLINSRQFQIAYSQWENPTQTYNEFVTGYNDTQWVAAYFGFFRTDAPYSTVGRIPGLLYGYRYNGTVVAFSGWYELRHNPDVTGMAQWTIVDASFGQLLNAPAQTPEVIDAYLDTDPYDPDGIYSGLHDVLVNYYDAIVREDYWTAYHMWITPPQTYQSFVDGFSDTVDIVMLFGDFYAAPAGATSIGSFPVLLYGYHTDGSVATFSGCFHLGYDVGEPAIQGATLAPIALPTTDFAIQSALQTPCYVAPAG